MAKPPFFFPRYTLDISDSDLKKISNTCKVSGHVSSFGPYHELRDYGVPGSVLCAYELEFELSDTPTTAYEMKAYGRTEDCTGENVEKFPDAIAYIRSPDVFFGIIETQGHQLLRYGREEIEKYENIPLCNEDRFIQGEEALALARQKYHETGKLPYNPSKNISFIPPEFVYPMQVAGIFGLVVGVILVLVVQWCIQKIKRSPKE